MSSPLHLLLAGLVDYAGLFPPAALDLAAAVAEDAAARHGEHGWMLGRFVVPAARLDELAGLLDGDRAPLPVSVLAGAADRVRIENADPRLAALAVEVKAATREEVESAAAFAATDCEVFVELAADPDPSPLLAVCAVHGLGAKIRTGGTVPEAFPSAAGVARFVVAAARAGVSFKATAGLHHPLPGEFPLTYEPGCPRGTMHGFLPLFAGAALVAAGRLDEVGLEGLLAERSPGVFVATPDTLSVRGLVLDRDEVAAGRRFARAFGSCSFREPVEDLRRLGLLPDAAGEEAA